MADRSPVGPGSVLTAVEREVLRLLVTGLTNKAVARRLAVSERTIERHRASVFRKFGVRTLVEAARLDEADSRRPVPQGPHWQAAGVLPARVEGFAPGLFEAVFRGAASGFAVAAPDGRFLAANDAFCRMLGMREAELLATDVAAVTWPADAAADMARFRGLFTGPRGAYRAEKRFARKDGVMVPARLTATLVRGTDGAPLFAVGNIVVD